MISFPDMDVSRYQINDQGKEYVNQVAQRFDKMTGREQKISSAYHPQSNG